MPTFEIPGMPGAQMGMVNLGDMLGKAFGGAHQAAQDDRGERRTRCCSGEESDKLLDQEKVAKEAIAAAEKNGIVFIDEIDKICRPRGRALRRRCQPRRRAARPAAADRGHHGRDQARRR